MRSGAGKPGAVRALDEEEALHEKQSLLQVTCEGGFECVCFEVCVSRK